MKKLIWLIIFLFAGTGILISQSVSNVSINGKLTEYNTVYGAYDLDNDTLSGPDTSFVWISYDQAGENPDILSSDADTLELTNSLVNKRLRFIVHLTNSYGDTTVSDTSTLSALIIANSLPVVEQDPGIVKLSGNMNVGSILLADYDYSDADGDAEGSSIFVWYKGDSPGNATDPISGATSNTYNIQMEDTGQFFRYDVSPVAATGNKTAGTTVTSSASEKVNNAPYVDNVVIPATVDPSSDILVEYLFHDPDSGDDDVSTFRWFRDGVEFINQSDTYTTIAEDQGSEFYVIITPVSDNGYPNTGDDVISDTCTVSVSTLPLATDVCIYGDRDQGKELKGYYTYDDNGLGGVEGDSWGEWLVDDGINGYVVVKEGIVKQNKPQDFKYILNGDTVDYGIIFRVTPKKSATVSGISVSSAALAKISNIETNFSIVEPPVILGALPEQGTFSSSDAYIENSGSQYSFDPGDTANFDIDLPILIQHSLITTAGGCVQKDWITFNVNAATTYFTNDQDVYCSTEPFSEIDVEGLPGDYLGGGMFNIYYSDGISRTSSFSQITDRKVRILPPQIPPRTRPGGPRAKLSYRYSASGISYEIIKDLYVDSIGVYLAITNVDNSYCENDDTINIGIKNFYPTNGTGTWNCLTTDILRNEDNFSATLDPSLKPSGGPETIQYTYTIPGGCSKQVSTPLIIHPKPQLDFSIVDGCIEDDKDTTRFINSSPDTILVYRWLWEFGEIFPSISEDFEPGYMYRTEGERDVTLIGTTFYGCSDTLVKEIGLGVKPEGDFYWEDDCFNPSQDLKIFDDTRPTATIESRLWDISHSGGTTQISNVLNPTFPKTQPEVITVNYYLFTAYPGCQDTVTKDIYIRPTYSLSDSVYNENFEGAGIGWVKDASEISTWEHGIPAYLTSQPDGSAWYTGILTGDLLEYAVESPCFDFRGLERPMIKMDIITHFDEGRDGAVLQYKEGNNTVWENIGGADYGINWYKNSNISGRPGGSVVGWSPEVKSNTFAEARQYLDKLTGKEDVKLRISYGSDGNAQDSKGFAFDNIWIGERSRKVLVEHFTNYNSTEVVDPDIDLNSIIDDAGDDALNIQYHTNYRAGDLLYLDNTAVPSSRMLFYSLVRNPYTIFDGGTTNNFAGRYDWNLINATINDLKNRSLTDPLFNIQIDTLPDSYKFNVSVKALDEISASNMTLYLAVVASEIDELSGSNGQTVFYNVLRKMIPDVAGISLNKNWSVGDSISKGPYSRSISMEFETDSVEVIAFLQNNITKEVYQAASSGKLLADITTSIGRVGFEEATFKIFPNPASTNLTFLFDRELTGKSELRFYNNTGVLVKEVILQPGIRRSTIDNLLLPSGIYLVKLSVNNRPEGYRKLIITGQ